MSPDRIVLGYNAVDNDYFETRSTHIRSVADDKRRAYDLPDRYFLVVGRMVPEKNLSRLVDAYARFFEPGLGGDEQPS